MQINIDTVSTKMLDWGAKGEARIIQNVLNILKTLKYEVAYDRTFGLTGSFIDKPFDQAAAITITEVYEEIGLREPRSKILDLQQLGIDQTGNMQLKVVIDIE